MTRTALCAALSGLLAAGCSTGPTPEYTDAEVVVTINGKPLPNALVTLTPKAPGLGSDAIATGVTDATGRVKLTAGGKPGACVGANLVTVAEGPEPEGARGESPEAQAKAGEALFQANRPIPPKYATAATTDLSVEVTKGQAEYKLDLTRPGPAAGDE